MSHFPVLYQIIFLQTGLSGALITLIFGQIYPQLLADEYPTRTLNSRGSLASMRVSCGLEKIGLFTSFSFLALRIYSHVLCSHHPWVRLASSDDHCDSPSSSASLMHTGDSASSSLQKSGRSHLWLCAEHWFALTKQIASCAVVLISAVLVLTDVLLLRSAGHPVKGMLLLLLCMTIIFFLEGLQLAVLSLPESIAGHISQSSSFHHWEEEAACQYFRRAILLQKSIQQENVTVKRFLIGRQVFVVMITFLASTICSAGDSASLAERFHLLNDSALDSSYSPLVSLLCNPNIAEIFLILNLVILPAQLLARKYPIHFLNLPGCEVFLRLSLFLESLGVAHFGWYLFYLTERGRLSDTYHTTSSEDDDRGGEDEDETVHVYEKKY